MPRKMAGNLIEALKRKDKSVVSHTTLQVNVNTSSHLRSYYFATAKLFFGGITWEPQLRRGSQIRSSLTAAADKTTVEIQNVDTELGKEFLSLGQSLYNADCKIGRLWIDKLSGEEFHKTFLTGILVSLQIAEDVVRLTAVSEPYANVDVGASRRVSNLCQWQFRNPNTCGYAGSLLTCNFMINDTGGCEGRHGTPLKRAKNGGFVYMNSKSRLKTI
jgi:hypothetical protein